MKKLISLHLENLKNPQHFNFMDAMKAAITLYALADGKYSKFVTKFLAAFAAEDEAYQKYDRKTLSQRISKQNSVRQMKFRLLRDVINVFKETAGEEKRLAAERLLGVMDLYGGIQIPQLPMDSLTGVLTNLIEDFLEKYNADVQLLEIGGAVQNLKSENETFKELISQRTQTDSEIGKEAMAKARAESDRTLRMLFTAINLDVEFGDAEATIEPFIAYVNTEIDRYRILIGQGVGGGSSSSGGSSGGSGSGGSGSTGDTETSPTLKNATFKKADGSATIVQFAVGAPIEYPLNTVGYKWKPLLELMPKTNKTFTEVPIVDRETIATFHLADHTEEEIKQFVGTLLHTPANTDGYFWLPTPSETMPAEDTQYYEQPIENNDNNGGDNNGGDNGNYPPGYDPDADEDPGV